MRIQTNGLEGIGATGRESRGFRGRRSGEEMVGEHKSWELHAFYAGGLRKSKD